MGSGSEVGQPILLYKLILFILTKLTGLAVLAHENVHASVKLSINFTEWADTV